MTTNVRMSLSRRDLFRKAAVAPLVIGALAALRALEADAYLLPPDNCVGGWIAKPDVDYQNHPKGRAACRSCTRFHRETKHARSGVCDYVCGPVSASGWCDKFEPRS